MHRATRDVWFVEEWEVAQKISTPSLPPSLMKQQDRFWQHSPGSEPITSQISIPSPATAAGTSVQRAASQQIAQGGGGAQAAAAGSVGGGGVGREENGEQQSQPQHHSVAPHENVPHPPVPTCWHTEHDMDSTIRHTWLGTSPGLTYDAGKSGLSFPSLAQQCPAACRRPSAAQKQHSGRRQWTQKWTQ